MTESSTGTTGTAVVSPGSTEALHGKNKGEMITSSDGVTTFYCPYNGGGKQDVTLSSLSSSNSSTSSLGEVLVAETSTSSSSTSSPSSMATSTKQHTSSNGGVNPSNSNNHGNSPVCKNCLTSTTPLWRRDENGAVLCNACGLFLKLHGRPRPISLKTDVIKSRNRKGTHHHHQGDSSPDTQHKRSNSDDKKRKQQVIVGETKPVAVAKNKRIKTNEESESNDICSAANTLEILMSSDSSKPKIKPKLSGHALKQEPAHQSLSPSQSATQLPHLSTLLGEVNEKPNSTQIVADQTDERSAVPSPKTVPQNNSMGRQLSFHMTSIKDVLNSGANDNKTASYQNVTNSHNNIPVTASSSTSSLVRGSSIPQRFASPPPSAAPQRSSTLPMPATMQPQSSISNDHQQLQQQHHHQSLVGHEVPLTVTLQNEEEVIKLKTRINELELVTDLYKRHIFELDERCKMMQVEIQNLRH